MLKTNFATPMRRSRSPKRKSPKKTQESIVVEKTETPHVMKPIKSVPLDYVPRKKHMMDQSLLLKLDQEEDRDRFNLFHAYDELRLKTLYDMTTDKPLKHRLVGDAATADFKVSAYLKIIHLRLDPE